MVLIKNETLSPSTILVVDDDRTALMTLETRLQSHGYKVLTAINGKSACEIIEKEHLVIDAILLDRMMPEMDGLQVIEWLKRQNNLTKPPIIMQTASDRPDQIKEGIDAGVFYYLTKPIAEEVLRSVVSSAVKESKQKRVLRAELSSHRSSFQLMNRAVFHIQTISEAENISCFVANCFPDPEVVLPGVAELIVNAIEHGNLSISYDDKTALLLSGKWREEMDKRAQLPENTSKKAEVDFVKDGNKYAIKISDQGKGFFWQKYMDADPSRALESHGRGIARANMIFSKLQYNKEGNQVLATIDSTVKSTIDW
jgi:two-component system cell cycle response regulator